MSTFVDGSQLSKRYPNKERGSVGVSPFSHDFLSFSKLFMRERERDGVGI